MGMTRKRSETGLAGHLARKAMAIQRNPAYVRLISRDFDAPTVAFRSVAILFEGSIDNR